jgi:diguanylate cyclase (GGDEF)-like protein
MFKYYKGDKMETNSFDPLTGLMNRDSFDEALHIAFRGAKQKEVPLALVLFDVDHFLQANETHGHQGGDAILKTIAEVTDQIIGSRGQLSRYGGDEFAGLFENTEREQAFLVMEQVRAAVEVLDQFANEGTTIEAKVTITGGVAAFPIDGSDENELFRKADGALYRAKMTGRNKFVLAIEERMVPKTAHFTQTQLERLSELSGEQGVSEAVLLREALDDLLVKYKHNFLFFERFKGN